ncbi:Peptidyl-tRNA hydrolase ArfB [compost metagenome]
MADLFVAPGVVIPEEAIAFSASRASGPGGQNVNKVASKVELRVAVSQIRGLSFEAQERLRLVAGKRWIEGGFLLVTASETRNQPENRALAEQKLVALVQQALIVPKKRKATKPTKGSQERRVASKKARSQTKKSRGAFRGDD